jgi:ADP-ribose pyrophosphatase YjhB (NUDIX family)
MRCTHTHLVQPAGGSIQRRPHSRQSSCPGISPVQLEEGISLDKSDASEPMLALTERYARFGPPYRRMYVHVPRGGVCLSAFVAVRNREGGILFGRPRINSIWPERGCLPLWRVREIRTNGEWILPASHLLMGESPEAAANRIARIWLGLPRARPQLVAIDSSSFPTGEWAGYGRTRRRVQHWTLCFLYELRRDRLPRQSPLWEELEFFSKTEARRLKIGRLHRGLLPALK